MNAGKPLTGSVLAAIGASVCCVVPLVLVLLGVTGAWLGVLHRFEPLRPVFVVLALGLLGWAFWSLYIQPRRCAPGEACAQPAVLKRQRVIFWLVGLPLLVLLAFPWYAFLFY